MNNAFTVKVFPLPGCAPPTRGSPDATAFDVTARGVVSLDFMTDGFGRQLLYDFNKIPVRSLADSTPHVGHSYIVGPGTINLLRFMPQAMVYMGCGFILEMPGGMYASISARGSTVKKGLLVINNGSHIDHGFRGEPVIALHNFTNWFVEIGPEDLTLGQLSFHHYELPRIVPVVSYELLSKTARGSGNHGSTN